MFWWCDTSEVFIYGSILKWFVFLSLINKWSKGVRGWCVDIIIRRGVSYIDIYHDLLCIIHLPPDNFIWYNSIMFLRILTVFYHHQMLNRIYRSRKRIRNWWIITRKVMNAFITSSNNQPQRIYLSFWFHLHSIIYYSYFNCRNLQENKND